MRDRLKLFPVRHPDADKGDLLCDDVSYDAAKAAGFRKIEEGDADAPAPAGQWQGELRLENPGMVPKDKDVTLHFSQQFQGSPGSVAGLQFSNHADGPWETCRPVGGGAVEAPGIQWDVNATAYDLAPVQFHIASFVRGGIWPDQGLTGPPVVSSNAVKPKLVSISEALAPRDAE